MAKKANKDRIVSFRLTEEQFAPFDEIMRRSNIKSSHFFREVVLNKTPVFKESSADHERMLFLMNKACNNLNQLAFKVNSAHRRGIISERIFIQWLNNFITLRDLMQSGVNHVYQS